MPTFTGISQKRVSDLTTKSGHAVLLLHGLAGGPAEMNYLRRRLRAQGFVAEVPLLPGHCTHYSDLNSVKWQDYTSVAYSEFERLFEKYESVSVSGLCLGAILALCVGIRYGKDVSAICPISTTLNFDGWGLPYIARFIPYAKYTPLYYFYNVNESDPYGVKNESIRDWIKSKMSASSKTHYSTIPLRSVWEMWLLNQFVKRNLNHVVSPINVIHALEDEISSTKSVDDIRRGVSSTVCECVILKNSYHLATIDQERDLVANSVCSFISEHVRQLAGAQA